MPIELQSDLITSDYWQEVRQHLRAELEQLQLTDWKVVIRPKTDADEYFDIATVQSILAGGQITVIDRSHKLATLIVPDSERFDARDVAGAFAEEIELLGAW